MDVSMFRFEDHSSLPAPTADLIEKQAAYYRGCFKIFREYKEHIDSVTLWGVADDETWLDHFPVRGRKNWPLLFDEGHNPKEAFWRVVDF
jgi:endo-1,4-beta-xylanase